VVAIAAETRARAVQTVLLVEDYGPLLKRWARDLETDGKLVLAAPDSATALELVQKVAPDVAIVDLFLGNENGVDVVRKLREHNQRCYTVLVSSHITVAYAMAAVKAGADDVFYKPESLRRLVNCIERGVSPEPDEQAPTLEQIEWEHISRVLLECEGNVTHAAKQLGIYRQTLQRKMRRQLTRR
jgi:two-component system, response regulator RegA